MNVDSASQQTRDHIVQYKIKAKDIALQFQLTQHTEQKYVQRMLEMMLI